MAVQLIDHFHRRLHQILSEDMAARMHSLCAGGATAIPEDTVSTAEKYAAKVAYIQALTDIMNKCFEVEREIYGLKDPEENKQE